MSNPIGRPSKYDPETYPEQAFKYCLLGATVDDLARMFEVDPSTIDRWIAEFPAFQGSIKKGRHQADAEVANKLYRRAMGYSHEAVKIVADAKTGAEHIVPYTEHYPPDTTAAIFWLKNRNPANWRDKSEVAQTVKADVTVTPALSELVQRVGELSGAGTTGDSSAPSDD